MGSAVSATLIKHLLPQSDRRPAGCLSRSELSVLSDDAIRALLRAGVLIERRRPDVLPDGVVIEVADKIWLVPADQWDDALEVDLDDLPLLDINLTAMGREIRSSLCLVGAPPEEVCHSLIWLGAIGTQAEREGVFLGHGRLAESLPELVGIARVYEQAPRVTILTPTDWQVPTRIIQRMDALVARVVSLSNDDGAALNALPKFGAGTAPEPRLIVDFGGSTARLDGVVLELQRRDLAVLRVLASEASSDGGIVQREAIGDAISDAVGTDDRNPEQIDGSISRLRKKLGAAAIQTRKGIGYRLLLKPEEIDLY